MLNIKKFNSNILYIYPVSLIFSTAVSNLIVLYVAVIGLFFSFKKKGVLKNNYVKFFLLFCCFIFINTLLTYPNSLSIKSSALFVRYFFFIVGILYILHSTNFKLNNFFFVYLFLLILLFIDANFQTINNGVNVVGFNSYDYQIYRISSFFKDELILGSYIQKFTILFICYFHILDKIKFKSVNILVLLTSLEICLISGERTAFFSLLLFTFIYFSIFLNISIIKKICVFFILIVLGSIIVNYNNNVKSRIIVTYQDLNSANYRYFSEGHALHLKNAYSFFLDKPLSGYGSNNFRKFCNKFDKQLNIKGCSTHPHNLIAQFMSEKGVIGLIFLFVFFAIIIYEIIKRSINLNLENEGIVLCLIAILIFFNPLFPSANFYNSWVNNIISIIFLIILKSVKKNDF